MPCRWRVAAWICRALGHDGPRLKGRDYRPPDERWTVGVSIDVCSSVAGWCLWGAARVRAPPASR
jgi:hypothetical protein